MFESLPKAEDPLASHFGEGDNRGGNGADQGRGFSFGRWYDFYGANLQRLYGDPCALGSDTKAGVAAAAKADAVEATAEKAAEQPVVPFECRIGCCRGGRTDASDASAAKTVEPAPVEPWESSL